MPHYLMQIIWRLVRSSWILHASCNKRRVAHIAALLSSVLHPSLFSDEDMHDIDNEPGPLKWVRGLSLLCVHVCMNMWVLLSYTCFVLYMVVL